MYEVAVGLEDCKVTPLFPCATAFAKEDYINPLKYELVIKHLLILI